MFRQTILMSATTVARLATNVLAFILLARVWGPTEFGVFIYPMTLATLVTMLVDYGFGLQVVRDISRDSSRVEAVMSRALGSKLVLTAALTVMMLTAPLWLSLPRGVYGVFWLL